MISFFRSLFHIITHTPWWVWLLLGILLFRGIKALRSSTMSITTIFMVPAIFLMLSFYSLMSSYHDAKVFLSWALAIGVGSLIGWAIFSRVGVHIDKKRGLITIPGSPLVLIMILIIFSVKYCFGYISAEHSDIAHTVWFSAMRSGVSGIIAGMFIGRAICFWRLYKKAA